ncbi:MAG: acetyl-CoA carboxylase biotin carboxyl carrier protein subunit [candidate division Zixibacteria bacterium]|nr:acetyl-CoA carboxylase biotin carboxyl carrier protein subunit [candidate division Zixibacteria bacterium]
MPRYTVTIDEHEFDIHLDFATGNSGKLQATVNGRNCLVESYPLGTRQSGESRMLMLVDNHTAEVDVRNSETYGEKSVLISGIEIPVTIEDYSLAQMRKTAGTTLGHAVETTLKAPMPGMVLHIKVSPGDKIKKGETLVVIEAMKMENSIKAKADGTVKSIHIETGRSVEKGDRLVEFI